MVIFQKLNVVGKPSMLLLHWSRTPGLMLPNGVTVDFPSKQLYPNSSCKNIQTSVVSCSLSDWSSCLFMTFHAPMVAIFSRVGIEHQQSEFPM